MRITSRVLNCSSNNGIGISDKAQYQHIEQYQLIFTKISIGGPKSNTLAVNILSKVLKIPNLLTTKPPFLTDAQTVS